MSDFKLKINVKTTHGKLTLSIDNVSQEGTGCSALQNGGWVTIAFSMVSNDDGTSYDIFCGQSKLISGTTDKKLDFPLNNFRIGEGFTGQMR